MSDFDLPEIALISTALRRSQAGLNAQQQGLQAQRRMEETQREMASIERQRLQLDRWRQSAESAERESQHQNKERIIETRRLLLDTEKVFDELRQEYETDKGDWFIIFLGWLEGFVPTFKNKLEDLTDIKFVCDFEKRINDFIKELVENNSINIRPSETVKVVLPVVNGILHEVNDCVIRRSFIHPTNQTEITQNSINCEAWKKEAEEKDAFLRESNCHYFPSLYNTYLFCGKEAFLEDLETNTIETDDATIRRAFSELKVLLTAVVQIEADEKSNSSKNTLFTAFNPDAIDISEVHRVVEHIKTLRDSFKPELQSLAKQIPEICIDSRTGTINIWLSPCVPLYDFPSNEVVPGIRARD